MNTKSTKISSGDIRQKLELFLSYWKSISLFLIVSIAIGYTNLRYTTKEYSASATIKIRDEKQSKKLPGAEFTSNAGLFSDGTNKIKDEIETIQSRTLVANVVKNLKLNIRFYEQGSIKEVELYKNPPVALSFFASDSVIHKVDTTLYLKIKSPTKFLMFKNDAKSVMSRDDKEGKSYAFGDKLSTGFGDMVITPNIGKFSPKIGSNLKISINSVNKMINGYQKSISITTSEGSSVIKLELQQSIADKAIDILNNLIQEYNKDVLNDKEELIKVTSGFINNRLLEVSAELEKVDYTSEQLQKKNKLTALDSQADLNLQTERQTESQIAETSNRIQMISFLEKEMNSVNRTTDLLPQDVGLGNSNIIQITKNYNELVAQRNRILRNSSLQNPVVINLNIEIASLKTNLQNSLKNMKETTQLTLSNLDKRQSRTRGKLFAAPSQARKFRNIERQQGIKESLYLFLLEKREESAIRLGMYSANAKIIDKAYSSYRPITPNVMFTYLASILIGLAIPIGFIYVKDLLDTKLHSKDDLVGILNIPYLGDVPMTSKKTSLIKKVDYSAKAEAFRIIRSNIDFILKESTDKAKKVFITSTKAQEGKSHTSTNLASSISFSEKSVLLIEMDIRVPKIMEYLGLDNPINNGLSNYISDKSIKPQDIVEKHKDNPFLDIIPSGTIPPNPSELLMSDRVKELFMYFEDKYEYIIVDTSAVGIVSDTLLISELANMFIYIVSADGIDTRQLINIAAPLYEEKRLPNMTMLLNGVKKNKGGYGYGYGYGNNPNRKKKWYKFS
jgi:succinoglycan biosynthesis transport protein ExoP